MKIFIAYYSLSGNTKEVAKIILEKLKIYNYEVICFNIIEKNIIKKIIKIKFDLYILGSFTQGNGKTPTFMKKFIKNLVTSLNYIPKNVAIFGTGETQWGMEQYCNAVNKMAFFFKTCFPILKIEQMPVKEDKEKIFKWIDNILNIINLLF